MEKLKVYYGWSRIGNVRKKRALSVMYENEMQGCRSDRGQKCLKTIQDTVFERYQTEAEANDGRKQSRIFTEYSIFLDDKLVKGSLERCLLINYEADKNHVSKAMRNRILDALKKAFLAAYPEYKEPNSQLLIKYDDFSEVEKTNMQMP